jgi:adenylate cyclase
LLAERSRFSSQLKALFEEELTTVDRLQVGAGQRAAVAQRLIDYDATHERASRVLMRALADLGDRAQAVREYQRCQRALKETLDVEPSQATQALYADIRSQPVRREAAQPVRSRPAEFGSTSPEARESVSARSRLRVGVLLFQELSPAVDRSLAFSLSQEIAAALARFRWFDVIAPGIATETRSSIEPSTGLSARKEIDYVVDGTLRKSRDGLQISVRLLDLGQEAQPVWSDRFELEESQLHLLDELVTARIVGRIDPVILFIEGRPRRRERYGATGLLLRAIPLMYSMEQEKYHEAGKLITQAMDTDPENAMAAAWGAHWQVFHVGQGWARNIEDALAAAEKHALRAIRLDPNNAEALGIYAHVCAFLDKDYDSALYYFDRSLRLNPSLGFVWALSAVTHCYIGMPDAALVRMERYRDLAPFDPYYSFFEGVRALAHLLMRDYEQALAVGRRMVRAHPEFINAYKTVIAALGHLGRRTEARPYVRKLLLLEPGFTITEFEKLYPLKRSVDRKLYVKGLQLAGVPAFGLQRLSH